MRLKLSEDFYKGFIESLELEADGISDKVILSPNSPHFTFLTELMKIEDKVEEMVRRGYLPRDVADEALDRFWKYAETYKDFAVERWNERTEE